MKDITEYQTAVQRIRDLLRNWIETGIELFLELRSVEQSGVWMDNHKDFESFLREEFPNALGIVQYRHVIEALEQHGEQKVRQVGVQSCHALVSKRFDTEPEKKQAFHEVIDREIEKRSVPPDADWLTKQRKSILEEPIKTRATLALSREAQLTTEVRKLKAQLREANAKIRDLESKLEKATKSKKPKAA